MSLKGKLLPVFLSSIPSQENGIISGKTYKIINTQATNYCIDNADGPEAQNGSLIHMWSSLGTPNQQWQFVPVN